MVCLVDFKLSPVKITRLAPMSITENLFISCRSFSIRKLYLRLTWRIISLVFCLIIINCINNNLVRNTFPDFPFVFFRFWPFTAYMKIATTIKFEFIPFAIRDSTLTWSEDTVVVPSLKVTWQVYVPSSFFVTSYIVSSRSSAEG